MCAERGVAAELAMEAPMACGFGACFGCAVPLAGGGYMRLCVDGPVVNAAEIETALVAGIGALMDLERRALRARARAPGDQRLRHLRRDRRPARLRRRAAGRAFPVLGLRLEDDHARAAGRQPAAAALRDAGGDDQLDRPARTRGSRASSREDLPELAELPVPLIVSVMATEPRGVRAPGRAASAERDEVAAIELNVSCPNVKSGLIVGEQPAETLALLRGAAPADRQAADREADAERRRPGGGRARRPRRAAPTRSR